MKKKSLILKIAAGTAAFLLIALLLTLANAFAGNPLSAAVATAKIRTYVESAYAGQGLEVSAASYNFKFHEYYSMVTSPKSEDTAFSVAYSKGRITDRYEYEVANRMTTYRRLTNLFDKDIEQIVAARFPFETRLVLGDLDTSDGQGGLELDMPYDLHNLPLPAQIVVWTSSESPSYTVLADRLLLLDRIMKDNGVEVDCYSMSIEHPYHRGENGGLMPESFDSVSVFDFPASRLSEENLPAALEAFHAEWESAADKEKQAELSEAQASQR